MIDELEAMAIYDNEIAPLEEMVGKLEGENNRLQTKLMEKGKKFDAALASWSGAMQGQQELVANVERLEEINADLLAVCYRFLDYYCTAGNMAEVAKLAANAVKKAGAESCGNS